MSDAAARAARELLIRRRARADILEYARAIDVPGRPLSDDPESEIFMPVESTMAMHHQILLRKLDEVVRTPHGRMMIFMPPGSAKSTYASVVFPSMYLGQAPGRRLILASYGDDLARKMGRRTRAIIKQPRFRGIWSAQLASDSSAAQSFALTNGSEYMACGILGGVTGNRANCMLPGTMIETDDGPIAIEHLFENRFSGNVLSYEHDTQRVVRRPVPAMARREAQDFYRIVAADGTVVEATGDHRIWTTTRGWVEARFLTERDYLLHALPCGVGAAGVHDEQGRKGESGEHILRSRLHGRVGERDVRAEAAEDQAEKAARSVEVCSAARVRGLQRDVQAENQSSAGPVLFEGVQGSRARHADDGGIESGLARWCESCAPAATCGACVSVCSTAHCATGQFSVRGVRFDDETACAPYRHERVEQSMGEFGHAVRALPPEVACGRAFQTEEVAVAMVERVHQPTVVYDIQVATTECFFANGMLVHNCIIVDDPIKGREQANSETIRKKTHEAFQDDLLTRLIPGGSVVIIQTRWHEDDLAGRILPHNWNGESGRILCKDGNEWEVLCLQAKCEVDNDPLGRAHGEYLWPEWFTRKHWAQFESNPRTWSALYQQRPAPLDGDLFEPGAISIIPTTPSGVDRWIRGWDFGNSTDGDPTTGGKLGRLPDGRFVIGHMVRVQQKTHDRDRTIKTTADVDGANTTQDIPQDPGAAGKSQVHYLVTQTLAGHSVTSSVESGDKITRAEAFAAQVNVGNVVMVKGDWNQALLDELRTFPNGTHDDQVDALSRAFNKLMAGNLGMLEFMRQQSEAGK